MVVRRSLANQHLTPPIILNVCMKHKEQINFLHKELLLSMPFSFNQFS